jgi:hypothetical protein
MKKIYLALFLAIFAFSAMPGTSLAASKTAVKPIVKTSTVVQKAPAKKIVVAAKKKPVSKKPAKKKGNGTSKLLSAPLIDPNNPPGGR